MKGYKGFLIDLDGTMYRGTEKIDEAVTFVKELEKRGLPYLFVTNNSTKRPDQVAEHLREFDVPATTEHVFTTSMATATYISEQKKKARVCMIGEEGLKHALEEEGHQIVESDADFVVMGLDRAITYEKLATAALNIRAGATFIATNGDVALPTERGLLPGAGSLISVLSVTTGVTPKFIGKPESIIVEQALEVIGLTKEETIMIGDNYHTDILAGIRAGMDTLMVYTGVSTKDQVEGFEDKPTHAIDTLAEWTLE
ncbi:TIGR01457 family HAD-type hydrolase [Alkalihalobacillus sp. MEB130]|uniref:TIGR01457 family HAD-type hydrolase n=1 Tax=Alkalihalobacillus sp. MEB130 TaxID=2976704 RepID=UPI0028DE73E3|nr:TIGR01457 family HAD-type hydrolase [Alkalihalobacillus sp. MEB130]MDT8858641.1 TIGR01457 family HAD-type hydrolase [Alkalihalobacillus sp. MEB130]